MRTTNDLQASALDFAHRVLDAVFETYRDARSERLRELCDSNLKVFGTAAHEKAHDLEGFLRLFPATPEAGFEATSWRFDFAETFTEDRVGWVWGEVESRLKTGGEWIDFPIRTTFVMHLVDGNTSDEAFCWRLLHFHCSFPDQQQPDEYLDVDALQAHSRMLEEKVAARTAELERSLDELRRTQKQLIQQEKLASLGALTAGIAHEIKNPLNFVNNFAQLSAELVREIEAEQADHPDVRVADVADMLDDLKANVARIEEHGRRADSIVRSMLAHSRGGRGTREAVDVNRLVDEYVSLAYHGARAQRQGLNATIERDLDPAAPVVEAVPEDLGRVLLNLVSNALYAIHGRLSSDAVPEGYAPMLRVSTKAVGEHVEIRVWDNGGGIPDQVRAHIFEPFFTTKPTGEGTGLGLSLSHDIVAAHGGTLKVDTSRSTGTTEFTVLLPCSSPVATPEPIG